MTTTLKPGLLISLKTVVSGGVHYERHDLAPETAGVAEAVTEFAIPDVTAVSKWETTRRIDDVTEYERAQKARNAISSVVRGLCISTAFGLICPETREAAIDAAIAEARAIADAHNATANYTSVSVYILKGRIASSDVEAARAIASEVQALLDAMSAGISQVNVKAIRDAAQRARKLGSMLDGEQGKVVSAAVEAARKAASEIAKRVERDGESASAVLAEIDGSAIATARFAFLDFDAEVTVEELPVTNMARVAGLELN